MALVSDTLVPAVIGLDRIYGIDLVQSAECRVQSAECRVQSAECRVQSAVLQY
eukprot:SAG11_NODE_1024_length_6148_cov_7.090263_4_plen_53_part_00